MQTGAATVENSMEIPQKTKNGSAFWPRIPTSGNISKGTQNTNSKEHKHPSVHCSVIHNPQDMEAAQVSISRWVDKTTLGHLHSGILLRCKKQEIVTLCNSMDGPGEYYAKWNNPVKDKYHMISLMCRILWTELPTSKTETDSQTESRMTASGLGKVRVYRDRAKKKKDSWTWTTLWWLLGAV